MSKEQKTFRRKLSLDESREGYIFIPKDALGLFPADGGDFKARLNGQAETLSVETVLCNCRGPGRPHEHYHLSFAHAEPPIKVRRGSMASIKKEGNTYNIDIGW